MFNNYFPPNMYGRAKISRINHQKPFLPKSQNIYQPQCEVQTKNERKEDVFIEEPHIFEIFGIKIYFDDLLIICILIFLYQEGIQDEYLFIALILLLLS